LTGKYKRGAAPAPGTRLSSWTFLTASLLTDQNFDRVERLEAFAIARGHRISELAIAWLLAKRDVPSVIAGATSPAQVEANAHAATWRLTAKELAEIDDLLL
jgi:aryl-alcohol dehydrogenase-like predicted oxidoreductase